MEFINKCIDYLKANPLYAIIIAAAVVAIVVVLIVISAVSAKKRKNAKLALEAQARAEKDAAEKAEAKKKAEAEKKEKAKADAETWARLEAERKAAEEKAAKEEAERIAAEEKAAKEEAERKAAEEKAAKQEAERKAAEEKTAKQEAENYSAKTVSADDSIENDELEKTAKYTGKWIVSRVLTDEENSEEMFFFELRASNGEKLLSSEEYTTYAGALRGIETHKANIERGNLKITVSKKGDFIFKLLSGKNMLLCMGEKYSTRARCESAIESTKRFAKTAVLDENVQDIIVKVPVEDDQTPITPVAEGYNGKWLITSHEDADGNNLYYFELFANNGEKLLSGEEYTSYIGAVNGIQTHKTNIEKNNFRISLTKRGDYIYKLLNGNGQLLCLGEHYKTKRLCMNAVESVRRFAMNSPVLIDPKLKQ